MSVAGVALATIISQTVSACMVTRMLMKEEGALHLDLHHLGFHMGALKQILLIGLPAGLQSTVFSLSNVVIQSAINSFGSTVVAGSSASANLEGFVYTAMNAFSQAAVTFTSQNMGARKYQNLDRVIRNCLLCAIVTGVVLGGGAVLAGHPAAALLLLGCGGDRCRIRAPAGDLRHLPAVRHHGYAGQQPARPWLQRAAHGGEPCGQLPAASGVDRHHLPAEPHTVHAVHQLPHQLGADGCGASHLPAGGAAQDGETENMSYLSKEKAGCNHDKNQRLLC